MNAGRTNPFRSAHFYLGVAQAVFWVVLGVALTRLTLSFMKIFEDFDVNLSAATVCVIQIAFFLTVYWYVALLAACAWPWLNWGVVLLLSSTFARPSLPKRLWYVVTWSVPPLFAMMAVFALMIALIGLIQRLT